MFNLSLPEVAKNKIRKNWQILCSETLQKQIAPGDKTAEKNGKTKGFRPQTQNLEAPPKTSSLGQRRRRRLHLKGEFAFFQSPSRFFQLTYFFKSG